MLVRRGTHERRLEVTNARTVRVRRRTSVLGAGLLLWLAGCGGSGTAGKSGNPDAGSGAGGSTGSQGGASGTFATDGSAGASGGRGGIGDGGSTSGNAGTSAGTGGNDGGNDGGTTGASGASSDAGSGQSVGHYDAFELTLSYPTANLTNPWENVTVMATVTTPSGKSLVFDGFYYDTDTYKVRFAPAELGDYRYTVNITGPTGSPSSSGTFRSVASKNKGFLREHPSNPYRLIFEKGEIANAIGLNDCWGNVASGPLAGSIEAGQSVDLDTYMSTYGDGGGGFNVFRWNPANCSFDIGKTIAAAGNTYLVPEGKRGDELLATAHAHGFHVMFTFFHLQEWNLSIVDTNLQGAVEKAIRYAMARYGAYADIWELTNESGPTTVSNAWLQHFAPYVRAHDPYERLVTNSWERASDWTILDARSPHINIYDDALVDEKKLTNYFSTGAPVIAGEMYDTGSSNWSATSARQLRVYAWSAFMSGLVDVYWNMSYKKGSNSVTPNMYIGAEERGYIAELQKISASVDPDAVLSTVGLTDTTVTAHALRSPKTFLVYAYRWSGSGTAGITVDVPFGGTATWLDPKTGAVLAQANVSGGSQLLQSPSFTEDVVLTVK